MFEIFSGMDIIDINNFFKLRENSGNRGHKWTVIKPRCNTDLRKYFFSHRVVNSWKSYPTWLLKVHLSIILKITKINIY